MHTALQGANTSRSFTVQTILPGASDPSSRPAPRPDESAEGPSTAKKKAAPNYKIRNDLSTQTLEAMFAPLSRQIGAFEGDHEDGHTDQGRASKRRKLAGSSSLDAVDVDALDEGEECVRSNGESLLSSKMGNVLKSWKVQESSCDFTSIRELRDAVRKRSNAGELYTHHLQN